MLEAVFICLNLIFYLIGFEGVAVSLVAFADELVAFADENR